MDRIHNWSQKVINNLIYVTLVFILVYQFGLGINLNMSFLLQFVSVVLISLLTKFFLFNPIILYILLAIGVLIGLLVNHYIESFILPLIERIYYLMENIFYNLIGEKNISDDNVILFWLILIILVSLLNTIILFKNKNIFLLLPVYIGTFLYYWYNFYDVSYWFVSVFFLAFFILMGLDNYFQETNRLKENANVNEEKLYLPWIKASIKYSILIVTISLLLPKNYNYINWPWLQQRVYNTFPFVENLRSYDAYTRTSGEAQLFNFSMTGDESGATRLGGPVRLSDEKIMTIYASEENYLRGNVQQTYTGFGWQSIKNPSSYNRIKENFSDWPIDYKDSYYKYLTLTIQYHDFASYTLFSPYKAAYVDFEDESELIVNRDDTLVFPHGIYDGESYRVWAQKPLPYGILLESGAYFTKDDIEDIDIYLQIPEDKITDRTKDLVEKIVLDSNSDYSKAIAIESFLRSNFEYSLSPDIVPEGQEFVDYFLFEEQEGYCTYYATAMAIMLRLEGVPTRYVEGYIALEPVEKGKYEVRHNNAHAWVEAFIEPVGWMQFEPTPAYPIENRMENYQPRVTEETFRNDLPSFNDYKLDDINNRPELVSDSELGYSGALDYESSNDSDSKGSLIVTILLLAMILILPIRYLIGIYKYKSNESRIRELPNVQRAIYLYKNIVVLIDLIGYPQLNGETHYEYAQRVGYKFYNLSEDNIKGFKDITDIFVRSKYGGTTSDEDIVILEDYRKILEIRLKKKMGTIRYFYNKYN
ncbi:MAG: transglutaminase domain-containing protein [Tissierellaceae bacterium]|nr:transglutaminase domain-containing protein [Tissierellaceae bacterium]